MKNPPLDIVFMTGPQGSGKGTQSRLLAEKTGFFHWENGAILREAGEVMLKSGKTVRELIDQGFYLTDEDLYEIAAERLNRLPSDHGIIFDGIPRRLSQAIFLLDFLRKRGRTNFTTIFLDISEDESFRRLLLRADIEHRADDTSEKIRRRLEQYHADTEPALAYLRKETRFIDIKGQSTVEEVAAEVARELGVTALEPAKA